MAGMPDLGQALATATSYSEANRDDGDKETEPQTHSSVFCIKKIGRQDDASGRQEYGSAAAAAGRGDAERSGMEMPRAVPGRVLQLLKDREAGQRRGAEHHRAG
jgi:hypothetical protein